MRQAEPARLDALLRRAREVLAAAGRDDAAGDARRLCEAACGATRTDFVAHGDRLADAGAVARLESYLARRIAGEPVHRILGWRGFHGLKLALSPETLEPRPDTEALVDLVLGRIGDRAAPLRILDLGTGSGAIALALLAALPQARATGADISDDALATARRNARTHGLDQRFETVRSAWFAGVSGVFDILVSNPPYIRSGDIAGLAEEVRLHDPLVALDGGPDGLAAYRAIAAGAPAHLAGDGLAAVEFGHDQKDAVAAIFGAAGFEAIAATRDLSGHDRAMVFRNANKTLGIRPEGG